MTTVRDLVTRSLRRLGVIDALSSASAEDMATGVAVLNEMIDGLATRGADVRHREVFPTGLEASDTFWMFIPPRNSLATTIDALVYAGEWDANANSPALVSSTGTEGQFYRVETSGSTELDGEDSWSVDDALIFNGATWVKARSSRGYESGVIAMLAVRIADEFGLQPTPMVGQDAMRGQRAIQAAYIVPAIPTYDSAIIRTPNRVTESGY